AHRRRQHSVRWRSRVPVGGCWRASGGLVILATVLRTGGPTYTREWAYALSRGRRHDEPYPFRVLTDDPSLPPSWAVRLRHDWPGWWSKLELWRPGVFPEGELVLYVDLDTLLIGGLAPFESYQGELAVLSDFYQPRKIASGVMLFRPGPRTAAIYEAFCADPAGIMAQHRTRSDYWYARV